VIVAAPAGPREREWVALTKHAAELVKLRGDLRDDPRHTAETLHGGKRGHAGNRDKRAKSC
jgi:hypothetical protein